MTCITALKYEDHVLMGADTAITTYMNLVSYTDSKLVKHTNCLIGFAGAKSVQNLMMERLSVFDGNFTTSHLNNIWRSLIECTSTGQESEMLIAYGSEVFWMGNIAGHRRVMEEFECIGNGALVAKGAMQVLSKFALEPEERVNMALQASAQLCNGVRGPFEFKWNNDA